MPSFKDIVEAMSASWPAAMAILLASAALLAGDHWQLKYLDALPDWLPGAAFLGAVLSGSVLVVAIIRWLGRLVDRPFRRRRINRSKAADIQLLNELPAPEIQLLAWAVANQKQVFSAPYFNEHVKALLAKGLIYMPAGNHHSDSTPFAIPEHVWAHLRTMLKDAEGMESLVGLEPFSRW